ncbi:hypothetical protein DCO58_04430 [Helicobacter saguini]|uniref:Uncharacterized protein n=1 Tax=Helicobacter saguini TaxID=1548018 RepID=A0A347W334_9HELI|nr:hypothetical protein [Helicobacter saguini]MWV62399.1 hypothetical protein [Helicobacter saguini]MWV66929.1 hypothetical protein [Helicobacter saguini]MWV69277.1 hypothetical protein [Helicobacter saguini]MWV71167.1 hypothetical protein [Helicobacter saguini]TLD94945.1 hypothetical protein LS64_003205 [Helicobacter saguini]
MLRIFLGLFCLTLLANLLMFYYFYRYLILDSLFSWQESSTPPPFKAFLESRFYKNIFTLRVVGFKIFLVMVRLKKIFLILTPTHHPFI